MTSRRRGPREPTPGPAAPDPVVQLPAPSAAELVAQVFSYPQLRAFAAHNPPGSANERVALDAIHLLIRDPELYRGSHGSQVDAIAAQMSPLDIVADRRVIPPGPLADTLTAALARQRDPDDTPDLPPRPAAEAAAVIALHPDVGAPDNIRLEPPAELEPEYLESLVAETEARIAAGETDLIAEIDPADEAALHRGDDLEDYYGLDDDYNLEPGVGGPAGLDPRGRPGPRPGRRAGLRRSGSTRPREPGPGPRGTRRLGPPPRHHPRATHTRRRDARRIHLPARPRRAGSRPRPPRRRRTRGGPARPRRTAPRSRRGAGHRGAGHRRAAAVDHRRSTTTPLSRRGRTITSAAPTTGAGR